ncbi:MAG TPA: hypothetical protein VLX61_00125 [Anaerolineales bacterium]|nr:hypothetical protein [Anaerolineales bacterium]
MKSRAQTSRLEMHALSIALHDPRTPWQAKALIGFVLAHALSPIDLIPVLGHLDGILIVPAGIALALGMIPADVINDARNKAAKNEAKPSMLGMIGMMLILLIWILLAAGLIWRLYLLLSKIKG